jgi:hypothetical protein
MATVSPEFAQDRIAQEGFAALDFSLGRQDHEELFQAFNDVIADIEEPRGQQIVDALTYQIRGRETDGDYYLVKRVPGDRHPFHPNRAAGTEHKYTAHIGPQSYERALDYFGRGNVPASLGRLLHLCGAVHEAAKETVRPVYQELGIQQMMLAENPAEDIHIVRLLRYLRTAEEKPKASLHFDRSVATLAISESEEGLVGGPGDNSFHTPLTIEEAELMALTALQSPVEHVANEAKFFLGAGYNHLRKLNPQTIKRLPLFLHGVINHEPEVERNAAVVFMNPRLGTAYTPPNDTETGIEEIRAEILRHRPPYEDD